MSEAPVDKEAQKLQQGHETPIQKRTLELKNCNPKPDPNDLKKDESNEQNTDSNKSNHVFQTPNPHSSSGSANRDFEYQSTPRRNNLNFLLGESNGKKSQTQKKILHHSNTMDSPFDKNYNYMGQYQGISPLYDNKMPNYNYYQAFHQPPIPGYAPFGLVFNGNEGIVSFNFHHKTVYEDRRQENNNFAKKLVFKHKYENINSKNNSSPNSQNEISSESEDGVKKPLPINASSGIKMNKSILFPYQPLIINPDFLQAKKEEVYASKKNFCKCKKSKCRKFYCECFANKELCVNCNCTDCDNTIENEIQKFNEGDSVVDENDEKNKIGNFDESIEVKKSSDVKIGCNCTKSNCLKKYCECYKAGLKCDENCRCRECANMIMENIQIKKPQFLDYSNDSNNFDYSQFGIQKISILIENKKITVDECQESDACPVKVIKNKANEIFIEISKSFLIETQSKNSNINSFTPEVSKFKKRKRNQSYDSEDYTIKNNRTACDTNKKVSHYCKDKDLPMKKLNLNDIDKTKRNFLK